MLRMVTITLLLALVFPSIAPASDVAKEKRWADQIVDALIDGDAVWLQADGQEFLGIFTEAEGGGGKRAAIIAHGIGVHPDWPQVVYPLRTGLPPEGWSTLSLQMPVLPNSAAADGYAALMDEVPARLDAGIAFLREQGAETIVLIAHSMGATMTAYYLSTGDRDVDGFVAIGMGGGLGEGVIDTTDMVTRISVPMLDLHGSEDLAQVLKAVPERDEAKAADGAYTRQRVDGANHFFDGKEDALVDAVDTWLGTTIAQP